MDLWVEKSPENYQHIKNAFYDFGMSLFDMTKKFFLSDHTDVFSFGRIPVRIDIITDLKGLEFGDAFGKAETFEIDNIPIKVINYKDLIISKQSAGRHKDLDDFEQLENKD
jgi:hypothetical protein